MSSDLDLGALLRVRRHGERLQHHHASVSRTLAGTRLGLRHLRSAVRWRQFRGLRCVPGQRSPILRVIDGWALEGKRAPIESLSKEPFDHDMRFHIEDTRRAN
jgi:hypothetical protein